VDIQREVNFLFPAVRFRRGFACSGRDFHQASRRRSFLPITDFEGAEFGYAAREVASPGACKNLAASLNGGDNSAIDQRALHGIAWNHGSGGEGSAGHFIDEDIYTAWTDSAGGACLVFDLATQSLEAGGSHSRNPRQMTRKEKAAVKRELQAILSTVRFTAPLRPGASNKHP
jgi:hypothetical protein